MEIALIENGNIINIGDYRDVFPNTSFTLDGPSDEFLLENNAKRVNRFKPYDNLIQYLATVTPYIEGDWVYTVEVQPLTAEEIQAQKDSAMAQIRATRNQLLVQSDWTQLLDTPITLREAWASYRQLLRDLPATISEPRAFNQWPHDPNWVQTE
jgi:hypothetical protein